MPGCAVQFINNQCGIQAVLQDLPELGDGWIGSCAALRSVTIGWREGW